MKRPATIPGIASFTFSCIPSITSNTASPSSGALQVWQRSLTDRPGAVADYKQALAIGGSRPLPELFAAAGIRFDFSEQIIGPLMATVRKELDKLSP